MSVAATAATDTMIDHEVAQELPRARYRAEEMYRAARRRGDVPVRELDARWEVQARVAGPAARLCALLDFERWLAAEVERLDHAAREAQASAAAAAVERHVHALDGISSLYVCRTAFTRMVDQQMLTFKAGALLRDRILVAKLIEASAPVVPVDEDELLTCPGCRHQWFPGEARR